MYNIIEFGAEPGRLCTAEIQSAIDKCADCGGGRVIIPAGVFTSGTLWLHSNVELYLETGAVLKASGNMDDYNAEDAYPQNWGSKNEGWKGKHLIIAHECDNVSVCGNGIIDGGGDEFFSDEKTPPRAYAWEGGHSGAKDGEILRPGQAVCFIECSNVKADSITMKNSPCWSFYFYGCEYVQIRGLKIFNPANRRNTDGIDIDCCRFVTVSDCIIDTGDDAVAIRCDSAKLKNYKKCEYITVTNCILSSNACAIRLGVGVGEINHVRVSNINVLHAGMFISFTTSYLGWGNAEINDAHFSGISASDVGIAVECTVEKGFVKNVSLRDMQITSKAGMYFEQKEKGCISDVALSDISLFITENNVRREKYVVRAENLTNMRLNGIKIFYEEKAWDETFSEDGCVNTEIINCILK